MGESYVDAIESSSNAVPDRMAGTYFSVGGAPYYCKQLTVSDTGYVSSTLINQGEFCNGVAGVCNYGQCARVYQETAYSVPVSNPSSCGCNCGWTDCCLKPVSCNLMQATAFMPRKRL